MALNDIWRIHLLIGQLTDLGDQAVTPLGNGLDIFGMLRVVTESRAQVLHALVDCAVCDQRAMPYDFVQCIDGNNGAGAIGQAH